MMMTKSELLHWLRNEQRKFEAFLDEVGEERMEAPGVCGAWSVKDIVAHLTGWQHRLIADMQAAQRGEAEPAPPWPAHLESEDAINAWIYETNRERSLGEVLEEKERVLAQYLDVIEALPDDIEIARDWRIVALGDRRFPAGEFFDHFRDDHEAEMRAWLAEMEGL